MKYYKNIFVVLVYRNCEDLIDLFHSLEEQCSDYRVIVVNSFYDTESENEIKDVAERNAADFLSVENKGYSYGNNQGIHFAENHYKFDYLIVCNPDVLIKKWNTENLSQDGFIYGPIIKTSTNKDQNPCFVSYLPFTEWISYMSYKHGIPKLDYINFGINRLIREMWLIKFRRGKKNELMVYGVHGAFLIFTASYLNKNPTPFLEDMFLFNEERYLAWRLSKLQHKAIVTKDIEIYHKEDGSMNKANVNTVIREKESFIVYYENTHSTDVRK